MCDVRYDAVRPTIEIGFCNTEETQKFIFREFYEEKLQVARGKVTKIFKKQCIRSAFGGGWWCWAAHKNRFIVTFVETSANPHICMLPTRKADPMH